MVECIKQRIFNVSKLLSSFLQKLPIDSITVEARYITLNFLPFRDYKIIEQKPDRNRVNSGLNNMIIVLDYDQNPLLLEYARNSKRTIISETAINEYCNVFVTSDKKLINTAKLCNNKIISDLCFYINHSVTSDLFRMSIILYERHFEND